MQKRDIEVGHHTVKNGDQWDFSEAAAGSLL